MKWSSYNNLMKKIWYFWHVLILAVVSRSQRFTEVKMKPKNKLLSPLYVFSFCRLCVCVGGGGWGCTIMSVWRALGLCAWMCCWEMITVLIVADDQSSRCWYLGRQRGFVLAMVYVIPLCVCARMCVCPCVWVWERERDRGRGWGSKDEEEEQADLAVIECWTWLYSKSLSL